MRINIFVIILFMVVISILIIGCSNIDGTVYEKFADNTQSDIKIPEVSITLVNVNNNKIYQTISDNDGKYKISNIPGGNYYVSASCKYYSDFKSNPQYIDLNSNNKKTYDILLKKTPCRMLVVTSTLLTYDQEFINTFDEYIQVLQQRENIETIFIKIDTHECSLKFGASVNNIDDSEEVKAVLSKIIKYTKAKYIMLLGGKLVIPRPVKLLPAIDPLDTTTDIKIYSDAWYVDLDQDNIVDQDISISRLPGVGYNSQAVVSALKTAIIVHNAGGFTMQNKKTFGGSEYPAPPYCVSVECNKREEFYSLLSSSGYFIIAGHGAPDCIYDGTLEKYPLITLNPDGEGKTTFNYINLNNLYPVVISFLSCNTAILYDNNSTLSDAFLSDGASAFIGRTTSIGIPELLYNNFEADIEKWGRIGDALFRAMRDTALIEDINKSHAGQVCLFGDPTLRRQFKF